jgi:hypothetical protein
MNRGRKTISIVLPERRDKGQASTLALIWILQDRYDPFGQIDCWREDWREDCVLISPPEPLHSSDSFSRCSMRRCGGGARLVQRRTVVQAAPGNWRAPPCQAESVYRLDGGWRKAIYRYISIGTAGAAEEIIVWRIKFSRVVPLCVRGSVGGPFPQSEPPFRMKDTKLPHHGRGVEAGGG